MKINDLFQQSVERPIDGVIKADDTRNLLLELKEYVVTRDVAKGLGQFTENYLEKITSNGVWISGFYGSGKSHLLKILSLILNKDLVNGVRPADIILPKLDDEILRANLQRCTAIPSKSLLFNIDQKFGSIGGNRDAAILEVFVKVLNEMSGYYGKQGYVAKFERDLDSRGEFDKFKVIYQQVTGKTWEEDRKALVTTSKANFAKAYSAHFGVPESEAFNLMNQAKSEYSLSIEDFADMVKEYLDKQEPGFRLNFFVDEIGQFIGNDSSRMLNLQTVAETLATTCNGRAWIFVTSQADIQGVLGSFKGTAGQDITKIQGRFETRLTLASADVREVIQKRLLAKKEAEPESLASLYDQEKDNLATLFRFGDGSVNLNSWTSSAQFCDYYPFPNYQFELFQLAIRQLSDHDAFEGKHTSVGERSMLSVFQEVVKEVCNKQIGALATFDLMYDGIARSLRGDIITGIKLAENRYGPLPLRILKAMFLLKWVREFKATPRNVAILLIDKADIDIAAHEKAVTEALVELEQDSLLQRNGEVFEFLTNVEKDIEQEIKNVEIDEAQIVEKLGNVLFSDILRDPKIRYEANGQDYSYARKLDGQPIGRGSADTDLAINIITAEHPNYGDSVTLAQQSAGKAELVAILPEDAQLTISVRDFLKTQKYLRQNSGSSDQNRQSILDRRSQQNDMRNSEIALLAKESLSKAPFFLNNDSLTSIGEGDPRTRFSKAAQMLITFAYPGLKKLKGNYDESTLSKTLQNPDDLLSGGVLPLSEAEDDVLIAVTRKNGANERISAEGLIKHFERRPYGWPLMATLTLIAQLFRMQKIDLRVGGESLVRDNALGYLTNNRQRDRVDVCLQQHFDGAKIEALKSFHRDFFNIANAGADPRTVGEITIKALQQESDKISQLLTDKSRYKFLQMLEPIASIIQNLAQKDYVYLLNNLNDFADELLAEQEDVLGPIKGFMNGPQRQAYDGVIHFDNTEKPNFSELPPQDVQPIRDLIDSTHPFRGKVLPDAKAAMERLKTLISQKLQSEREQALAQLEQRSALLQSNAKFTDLDDADWVKVLLPEENAKREIEAAHLMTFIRDRIQRYITSDYPAQLALAEQLVTAKSAPAPTTGETPVPAQLISKYTPVSSLRAECELSSIDTTEQLEEYLKALRLAAQAELDKGNRISL